MEFARDMDWLGWNCLPDRRNVKYPKLHYYAGWSSLLSPCIIDKLLNTGARVYWHLCII